MRSIASWESWNLDRRRMSAVLGLAGLSAGGCVYLVTSHVLGGLAMLLSLVVGVLASYTVGTVPKRALERSALLQAREAPVLAASAAVYLQSTGSRAKTLLMLRSDEPGLKGVLEDAKKSTLLGLDASRDVAVSRMVVADSVSGILASVGRASGSRLQDEGEELEGIVRASLSNQESKFPVFLTVSFFFPIMLMLLAAIGHHDDAVSLVSLAFLEVVVLDLVLSFASTERRRLSA